MLPGVKLFQLTGKTALITGGSKGLGLAIAEGLASAGADVAILARNHEQADSAARRISTEYGHRAMAIQGDVTIENDCNRAVLQVLQSLNRIDILVNSAGINIRGPIDQLSYDQFRQVQQTNVDGSWLMCKAIVPEMKRQQSGRIINLSSALGSVGLGDRSAYCTSKGAILQMTRALSIELAPFAVTVNAICPGPFLTEMNESVKDDATFKRQILGATALNRWGELHEIQGSAIYLASRAGSYTTGAVLAVDGGWTAQ